MGLDMYAYRIPKGKIVDGIETDFQTLTSEELAKAKEDGFYTEKDANLWVVIEDQPEEIKYWRKHPNLHGWMESLYKKKGGESDCFNCVNVKVSEVDLLELRKDIEGNSLPHTTGFFFSESLPEEKETDLEFIDNALRDIKDGYDIYYTSWW